MKKINLFLSVILIMALQLVWGQNRQVGNIKIIKHNHQGASFFIPQTRTCGTMEADAELRKKYPELGTLDEFEQWLAPLVQQYKQNIANGTQPEVVYTIPVIIHIIHNSNESVGTGRNISYNHAISQIDVLNEDFRRMNADTVNTPGPFKAVAADCEINFCPAVVDPNGVPLAEPGVHRVNAATLANVGNTTTGYSTSTIDNYIKPATIWDPNSYMNIWVCQLQGGLLGYAQFPNSSGLPGLNTNNGAANTDGVVIGYQYFGRYPANPYNNNFNLGRTATHEVGHWVGLRHIWGDANCGNDYCNDTPTQSNATSGCPNYPYSAGCSGSPNPPGRMFQNYMDYSDDACMNLFTLDQKARMMAVMQNSPRRNTLNAASATKCAAPVPVANFTANPTTGCVGTTVQFTDLSTNNPTSWQWSFPGGTPSSSTAQNPSVTYNSAGTYNVTLIACNANGCDTLTQTAYINIQSGQPLPLTEGFQGTQFLPPGWSAFNGNPTSVYWVHNTSVGGFGQSNKCAQFDNYNNNTNGAYDEMRTPVLNLTGLQTCTLTFDVAYARYDNTYFDALEVLASNNCGQSFTQVYYKSGSTLATAPDNTNAFVPTSTQWRKDTVILNAYAGQSAVMIAFRNIGGWGNNLYIDNINITGTTPPSGSPPVAQINASTNTVCAGQYVTFSDQSLNNPTSWQWTFPGGTPSSSILQNPGNIYFNTPGTYVCTLQVSNQYGTNSTTYTVTVNPKPTATASNNGPVCAQQTIQLSATGGGTYSWSGPNNFSSTQQNPSIPNANGSKAGVYQVIVTNSYGCKDTATTQVVVLANPNISVSPSNPTICNGSSVTLTASGAQTYTWSPSTGLSSTTGSTVIASPANTTTYTVTGTGSNGCSKSVNVTVTVNTPPTPGITQNGNVLTCTVTASAYQWYLNGSPIPGATSQSYTITQSGNYSVQITDANGCTAMSNTISATYVPGQNPPIAQFTASATSICAGDCINFTDQSQNSPTSWQWTFQGGTPSSSNLQNPSNICFNNPGTYTVTLTASNQAGSSSYSATITVNSPPTPGISQSGNVLTCTVTAAAYQWYLNGSPIPGATGQTYIISQSGAYMVEITDNNGCKAMSPEFNATYTGLDDLTGNINVELYPNPNNGQFLLNVQNLPQGNYHIYINDMVGKIVYNETRNFSSGNYMIEIDAKNLANGIYYLNISSDKWSKTMKFLVQ